MDAIDDRKSVNHNKSPATSPNQKPKTAKIKIKMLGDSKTNLDTLGNEVSSSATSDVHGQMYLWDISEDPNVVMRQSWLEEFLFKILTDNDGVQEKTFLAIVGYLMDSVSPKFKREVFFYMTKDGSVYRFTPPKFTGPAATEIWS